MNSPTLEEAVKFWSIASPEARAQAQKQETKTYETAEDDIPF